MGDLLPIILAGGSGTRLWPLSREMYPKQFLKLIGEHSLLQNTLLRLHGLDHSQPSIVCNEEHRFLVAEQCREIDMACGAIILEPEGRNTAPAIALAAFQAIAAGNDPVLLVLPADHHIRDPERFCAAVQEAATLAIAERLITFGVVPDQPHTGYGYIRAGDVLPGPGQAAKVVEFVEKPDIDQAAEFVSAGGYYWNSGMFVFRASVYLQELASCRPDIHASCEKAVKDATEDLDFLRPGDSFADCPSESIDYAVMENSARSVVVPVDIGWNDVGSWEALWDLAERDSDGNELRGDVISIDSRDNYVHANERLVAMVGVEGLVVVDTADAVLIARKDNPQQVKEVVARIKRSLREEHRIHTRVFRPWGSYETVKEGERYKVKRIIVNPGCSLSLQMHHHRSEHWVVVRGTAIVQLDDEELVLTENESTYIPVGTRHRLSNPGKIAIELIEVQSGGYLGEDDIVRIEDDYGRS